MLWEFTEDYLTRSKRRPYAHSAPATSAQTSPASFRSKEKMVSGSNSQRAGFDSHSIFSECAVDQAHRCLELFNQTRKTQKVFIKSSFPPQHVIEGAEDSAIAIAEGRALPARETTLIVPQVGLDGLPWCAWLATTSTISFLLLASHALVGCM